MAIGGDACLLLYDIQLRLRNDCFLIGSCTELVRFWKGKRHRIALLFCALLALFVNVLDEIMTHWLACLIIKYLKKALEA
jgi:hypothetical protein